MTPHQIFDDIPALALENVHLLREGHYQRVLRELTEEEGDAK
jgi:hypothetical protein